MRILALDSSTSVGGAALLEGEKPVAELTLDVTATHSERVLKTVKLVLQEAGWEPASIDLVAVALGPGSFTGVRIGVATAKSLAYGWKVPLVGVSTLEAMAYQMSSCCAHLCPLIDARRERAYFQVYKGCSDRAEGFEPVTEAAVKPLTEILNALGKADRVVFAGDGARAYWDIISGELGKRARRLPAGTDMLRTASVGALGLVKYRAGQVGDPLTTVPLYLRRSEAEIRWEQKNRS